MESSLDVLRHAHLLGLGRQRHIVVGADEGAQPMAILASGTDENKFCEYAHHHVYAQTFPRETGMPLLGAMSCGFGLSEYYSE